MPNSVTPKLMSLLYRATQMFTQCIWIAVYSIVRTRYDICTSMTVFTYSGRNKMAALILADDPFKRIQNAWISIKMFT